MKLAQRVFEVAARGEEVQSVVEMNRSQAGSGGYGSIESVAGSGPIPIPARLRDSQIAQTGDGVGLQPQR
jgi:hypothetical protein